MFAKQPERLYYDGLQAYVRGDYPRSFASFDACTAAAPNAVSAHLFAAVAANLSGQTDAETRHLEAVVGAGGAMPDPLQHKYLPPWAALTLQIKITDMIRAEVPFDVPGACLALAERYQESGRLEEAIGLVQQLHEANPSDQAIALSLADLLMTDEDREGVIEAASAATNDSDVGTSLLHLRARALFALGHRTAAMDAFRDALAKSSRSPELLKEIRYDRALAFDAMGQQGRARQDFERIFAVDPAFMDVRERLAALT